jgi:hypothetical protein
LDTSPTAYEKLTGLLTLLRDMKLAVVGRGRIGGGLADFWEKAGHEVTRIGRDGGDVSEAQVVLVAVDSVSQNSSTPTSVKHSAPCTKNHRF